VAIVIETLVDGDPVNATVTPTADAVPVADGSGNLAAGWGGAASTLATLDSSVEVVERLAYEGDASGVATLNGSSKVVEDPASATATPGAAAIPIADGSGNLAAAWGGAASTLATLDGSVEVVERLAYEGDASGVATLNGSTQVVERLAYEGAASGVATLNGSSKVVEDPASANTTPGSAVIPIADGSGDIDSGFVPSQFSRWTKYTVDESAFTLAATSEDIELFSLPANTFIHRVHIKHSASFTGGAINSFTISVGIAGSLTKYANAFDVFQAPADATFQDSSVFGLESHVSATSIRVEASSGVGDVADATAGSVDIWVRSSTLPA
jgi:hypothetical protein